MWPNADSLSLDNVVVRSTNLIEAEVDGEVVALNVERGSCYGLNKVGSRVWRLIDRPKRIRDICVKLVSEYQVDYSICETQVLELLKDLRAEDMIEIREESAALT